MELKECYDCKQLKPVSTRGKGYGLCRKCSKKRYWKPKLRICKRCNRLKKHQAFNLCPGCYNFTFHIDKVRLHNAKRYHNIDPNLYKEATKQCALCGFDKIVDLHHLDHDKTNNSKDNLTGLCPNHHRMLHTQKNQKEIFRALKEKGFKIPEKGYITDGFFRDSKRLG